MDLDLGLALGILRGERYRKLGARLRAAGFEPDVNDQGNRRFQSWTTGTPQPVTVDFLIPPTDKSDDGDAIHHIESDLAAIVTPGLELAFQDRCWKDLSGPLSSGAPASRSIPVCGPGAFTVLKALAFGNRTEGRDAYDLFYVWSGVGTLKVVESLTSLMPNTYIDRALHVIERDFYNHDGPGPIGAAQFLERRLDDNKQADVVGYAHTLLGSLGKL